MSTPEETPDNELTSIHAPTTNYGIASDQFEKVIAKLPVDQADMLRWWYFYGKEEGLTLSALAKAAGVSHTTLHRVFRGTYGADLAKLCETLDRARRSLAERVANPDFIMTSLARRLFRIFDRTRALSTVAILWGKMGAGKTTCCDEYRRLNNHGKTIYFRCGSGMALGTFVGQLAMAMGVVTKNRQGHEVRTKIKRLLRAGHRLLIIDEWHQLFLTCRPDAAVRICEFLRECYDESSCGMVLIGTEDVENAIRRGPLKDALAQLVDRGTMQIPLPAKPTKPDVQAFLKHYGLSDPGEDQPEARKILADIIASSGLRKLTLHLRDGAAAAARAGQTYGWSHFVRAFDDIASISKAA